MPAGGRPHASARAKRSRALGLLASLTLAAGLAGCGAISGESTPPPMDGQFEKDARAAARKGDDGPVKLRRVQLARKKANAS